MNCFVPKPALKKNNSTHETTASKITKTTTSLLSSKSAENLSRLSRIRDRNNVYLGIHDNNNANNISSNPLIDPTTSSFIHLSQTAPLTTSKSHEFDRMNESLYNRYPDSTDLKISFDNLDRKNKQNGTAAGKPFVWVCSINKKRLRTSFLI